MRDVTAAALARPHPPVQERPIPLEKLQRLSVPALKVVRTRNPCTNDDFVPTSRLRRAGRKGEPRGHQPSGIFCVQAGAHHEGSPVPEPELGPAAAMEAVAASLTPRVTQAPPARTHGISPELTATRPSPSGFWHPRHGSVEPRLPARVVARMAKVLPLEERPIPFLRAQLDPHWARDVRRPQPCAIHRACSGPTLRVRIIIVAVITLARTTHTSARRRPLAGPGRCGRWTSPSQISSGSPTSREPRPAYPRRWYPRRRGAQAPMSAPAG
jgi:hypothetical protein